MENRLLTQARRIAEIYKDMAENSKYKELEEVLKVYFRYNEDKDIDIGVLYEVIKGEDGIWNYVTDDSLDKYERNIWGSELCILSCVCLLEFMKQNHSIPQDLEIRDENIPQFLDFLENNFKNEEDFDSFNEYWRNEMC